MKIACVRVVETQQDVRAINDLHDYLDAQQKQMAEAEELLENFSDLNFRQRMLLLDALKNQTRGYTIKEHQGEYRITYGTAWSDLFRLEELGLFVRSKGIGKEFAFHPAKGLSKRIGKLDKSSSERKASRKSNSDEHKRKGRLPKPPKGLFDSLD